MWSNTYTKRSEGRAMSEYVIQSEDGVFLSSIGNWVAEYPDAAIFNDYATAEKEYFYALEIENSLDGSLELIEDYGLESEESLLCMTSAEFRKIGLSKSHFTS